MKKLIGITSTLGLFAMAMALTPFGKVFNETYKVSGSSELGKAACAVCHAGVKGGKLNGYGKDLSSAMKVANTKKLTAAVLKAVEGKDSDGDGKSNIDEIKADSRP